MIATIWYTTLWVSIAMLPVVAWIYWLWYRHTNRYPCSYCGYRHLRAGERPTDLHHHLYDDDFEDS
jgi:hypothetical protein